MGFDAHDVAKEVIREVGPLVAVVRQHDPDLAQQLKRAAQSILLNIGEGSRRLGRDRKYHYAIASGSAKETLDAIDVAEAWLYVSATATGGVRVLLDRQLALLWRLTHSRG